MNMEGKGLDSEEVVTNGEGKQLFHFSTADSVNRPPKFTDYRKKFFHHESLPIVIDNGSYHCRVGWANEDEPRLNFRNVVSKPRLKSNGQIYNVVGDYDSHLTRTFDLSRSVFKSPFDSNVVYHYENMETIFDYAFDRLGIDSDSCLPHPVLCTECPLNPLYSRRKMAELFFEVYGVKSLAFGIDSIFSYEFNRKKFKSQTKTKSKTKTKPLALDLFRNGLVISSAHSSSHIIPIINGEPYLNAMCQLPVGGFHVTDYMKKMLSLQSSIVAQNLSWEKAEQIVHRHCYVAQDYATELKLFQKNAEGIQSRTKIWQFPFTPPSAPKSPSPSPLPSPSPYPSAMAATSDASLPSDPLQEKATKAEKRQLFREQAAKRFREMAAERKAAKIEDLNNQIMALQLILKNFQTMEDKEEGDEREEEEEEENEKRKERFWSDSGFSGKKEVDSRISQLTILLRKAKGEITEKEEKEQKEERENDAQKFPLLNIPDNQLTPEELKEKRKQRLLKNSSEGRARARMKKEEEKMKAEKEKQEEEERRRADPEAYLSELKDKYADLQARAEQRKKHKHKNSVSASSSHLPSELTSASGLGSAATSLPSLSSLAQTNRGKGERLTSAQRERMKLLTSALYEKKGKKNAKGEEDTFGTNDADWLLYRKMSKYGEDAEEEEDMDEVEKELAALESKLQEMDPSFISLQTNHEKSINGKGIAETPSAIPQFTEVDFQIRVGIERIRAPEILFQPSMIGMDQAGIGEMLAVVLRRLPSTDLLNAAACGDVFLSGGSVLLPGFAKRIDAEFLRIRPLGSKFRFVMASDPLLDAWRGASHFARSNWMMKQAVSKEEYEERGSECLRKFKLSYGMGL